MPLTGNQANRARRFLVDTELADDPWVINQVIGAINGDYGLRCTFVGYNSSSNYAFEISNRDPTNGYALLVKDDADDTIIDAYKAGVEIGKPLTVSQGLSVIGSILTNLLFASTKKLLWPDENAVKVDYAGDTGLYVVGKEPSTLYWRANGNYSWRDGSDVERMHLTTGATPVLTVGGVDISSSAVSASYTGAGTGGGGRNFTLGFQPKQVVITGGNSSATVEEYTTLSTTYSVRKTNGGNPEYSTGVHLTATGFRVSDGVTHADVSGRNYDYVAYR